MSEPTDAPSPAGPPAPGPASLSPLLASDPARVGGFWLDARLTASASGVAYAAHDERATPVVLILLSEGAARDAAARDRLAGTVDRMHIDTVVARGGQDQDAGRLAGAFRPADDPPGPDGDPQAPWVALADDGTTRAVDEADRVLAEVDLSWLPLQGRPSGPDFRLHWIDKVRPGAARVWPLPWPGRYDRAGWLSILVSWLLMMLLMLLAVLVAILIFQGAPPQQPPPPVPTSAQSPPPSASPSPGQSTPPPSASPSPSPQSASPSPQSASPSPSPQPASPTPDPSASAQPGSPTPNSRL